MGISAPGPDQLSQSFADIWWEMGKQAFSSLSPGKWGERAFGVMWPAELRSLRAHTRSRGPSAARSWPSGTGETPQGTGIAFTSRIISKWPRAVQSHTPTLPHNRASPNPEGVTTRLGFILQNPTRIKAQKKALAAGSRGRQDFCARVLHCCNPRPGEREPRLRGDAL